MLLTTLGLTEHSSLPTPVNLIIYYLILVRLVLAQNNQLNSRISSWYPQSLRLGIVHEVIASVGRDRRAGMEEPRRLYRLLDPGMWIEGDQEYANLQIHSRRTICEESECSLNNDPGPYPRTRGYHSLLSSFGKIFHVEKRWKLIRELGSGAYGVVMSVYVAGIQKTSQ